MAHALEESNGQVAFALRGAPAWHNLANKLFAEDEHIDNNTMLDSALLSNWNIDLLPVETPEGYNNDKTGYFVTRTNPFGNGKDILGIVGERYKVVQNESLFDFGDNPFLSGARLWEETGHNTCKMSSITTMIQCRQASMLNRAL